MVNCFAPDCNHHSESHTCKFYAFPSKEKKKEEYKRWIRLLRFEFFFVNLNDRLACLVSNVVRFVIALIRFSNVLGNNDRLYPFIFLLGEKIESQVLILAYAAVILEMARNLPDQRYMPGMRRSYSLQMVARRRKRKKKVPKRASTCRA